MALEGVKNEEETALRQVVPAREGNFGTRVLTSHLLTFWQAKADLRAVQQELADAEVEIASLKQQQVASVVNAR